MTTSTGYVVRYASGTNCLLHDNLEDAKGLAKTLRDAGIPNVVVWKVVTETKEKIVSLISQQPKMIAHTISNGCPQWIEARILARDTGRQDLWHINGLVRTSNVETPVRFCPWCGAGVSV